MMNDCSPLNVCIYFDFVIRNIRTGHVCLWLRVGAWIVAMATWRYGHVMLGARDVMSLMAANGSRESSLRLRPTHTHRVTCRSLHFNSLRPTDRCRYALSRLVITLQRMYYTAVCLSFCLSVTRMCCIKTTQTTVKQSTLDCRLWSVHFKIICFSSEVPFCHRSPHTRERELRAIQCCDLITVLHSVNGLCCICFLPCRDYKHNVTIAIQPAGFHRVGSYYYFA